MNLINSKLTMNSLEIAELTDTRHDSVKRTIGTLIEKGLITFPQIVENSPGLGRRGTHYVFEGEQGKRDSIVVVAQISPEFTARLVDRWQELEKQHALPDFTNPAEAARAWADAHEALALAAPKAQSYDKLMHSDRAMTITDALGPYFEKRKEIYPFLQTLGWVYPREAFHAGRVYKQWVLTNAAHGFMVAVPAESVNGWNGVQLKITPRGVEAVLEELCI